MLPRGKAGKQCPCRQLARLRQAGHGSNLHFSHMAQASAALGFPPSISPRMHPYHAATVCGSICQHRYADLGTNTWWKKSPAPGSLSAPVAEGEGMLLDLLV